jgi:hypothetical protein
LLLLLVTSLSFISNGYHYATDDAGIYLPAILQHLYPSLYPRNAEFFHPPGAYSAFPAIAAIVTRCLGGSLPYAALLLHFIGIFLLLDGALTLTEVLFTSPRAAWSAVCLLACMFPIFAAGTSIPIMDPYLTARTLSTPLTLLAFTHAVRKAWLPALLALAIAFAIHPLMALFAAVLVAVYAANPITLKTQQLFALSFISLAPLDQISREAMQGRSFFFANRWSWPDWIGVIIPLVLYCALWKTPARFITETLRRLCKAAFLCGCSATVLFLLISLIPQLDSLVRFQPMRIFQLIYILFFLVIGGFLGEYTMKNFKWRWVVLFLAFGLMDFSIDKNAYPASAHIEWPGAVSSNPWVMAFNWARTHTPQDALFALPPDYTALPGEDKHGFRAIAERSSLADAIKDSGVVAIFPALGPSWQQQMNAQAGWSRFRAEDFHRLRQTFGVTWVIVQQPQSIGLDCPFQDSAVAVCRVE